MNIIPLNAETPKPSGRMYCSTFTLVIELVHISVFYVSRFVFVYVSLVLDYI